MIRLVKRALRSLGQRLGLVKQKTHVRDGLLADVINKTVNSHTGQGAFIVVVETTQAMVTVMSYMEKNDIAACAVTVNTLGRFPRLTLRGAINCMDSVPLAYRVYVMNKNLAYTGWNVPQAFAEAWGGVSLLQTFKTTPLYQTQLNGRISRLT